MNKDEIKKDEIKRGLEYCAAVGFKTACNVCPYCYRCNDLSKDALNIITEQEKEIERLKTENERFENNMKSVLEIEKENVRKETAKSMNY